MNFSTAFLVLFVIAVACRFIGVLKPPNELGNYNSPHKWGNYKPPDKSGSYDCQRKEENFRKAKLLRSKNDKKVLKN